VGFSAPVLCDLLETCLFLGVDVAELFTAAIPLLPGKLMLHLLDYLSLAFLLVLKLLDLLLQLCDGAFLFLRDKWELVLLTLCVSLRLIILFIDVVQVTYLFNGLETQVILGRGTKLPPP